MGTREDLIAAAARLLDAGGPAAVTLREVGRRAGVSHNAPYRHFADKEALLAAVASRELARQAGAIERRLGPTAASIDVVRERMRGYVRWAAVQPQRFKLTFGPWSGQSDELGAAAIAARAGFVAAVVRAQAAGELPAGDPERLSSLILAVAHGAADLALGGHLSAKGKGGAGAADLVDDLLDHLQRAGDR